VGWQRYILDLLADPAVDWVVILKAAQMGVSELMRCAIGRWAMLDPGDVLWVMASELAADKAMAKLRNMFHNSPALRNLWPQRGTRPLQRKRKESRKEVILANGMRIVIGWAGSASSLASDPFPRVILDETGLYPTRVGQEGSPIGLAEERTKTFGRRRKIVLLSKPAHADDLICQAHAECLDQRERHLPCPSCGHLAPLDWDRVRWHDARGSVVRPSDAPDAPVERIAQAAYVESAQVAWMACDDCDGRLTDTHSADADQRAAWVRVGDDTTTETRRRAVHISELYHWSRSLSDLVARFLRALRPGDRQNFYTGSLGLPYEHERSELLPSMIAAKATHTAGVVPEWATVVIASADTQMDHLWLVVRAWGPGHQSRLIDWGRVETFDELRARAFRAWPLEARNAEARAAILLIDAGGGTAGGRLDGSRSQQVYQFADVTPHVLAVKGTGEERGSHEGSPITWRSITFAAERKLRIVCPHANYWKDQLAKLVRGDGWEENTTAASPEYCRQMTGQRQVWEESTTGRGRWVWRKRRRRPDHLWDCSYLQVVGAEIANPGSRVTLWDQMQHTADYSAQQDGGRWKVGR